VNETAATPESSRAFRARLLLTMMLVIAGVTGLSLYLAQRTLAAEAQRQIERDFQSELARHETAQESRHAALAERTRALVRRPRIHAALEDDALDLLYPSASDELRDLLESNEDESPEHARSALRARFYRFLDARGTVIPPPAQLDVGELSPADEQRLSLKAVPAELQFGYLVCSTRDGGDAVEEVVAMPVISTETGERIAAFVVGFQPIASTPENTSAGMRAGLWVEHRLHLLPLSPTGLRTLAAEVSRGDGDARGPATGRRGAVDGQRYLLFQKLLNPSSAFPPASEICLFPLADAEARQQRVRWQILAAAAVLLMGGLLVSHFLSLRLARPVEVLAVASQEQQTQRRRAEAALKLTSQELQRAARFSADASHQLKTPVAVLRAGLEELLARPELSHKENEEIAELIHQTYRLGSIIEDLLLLSRMDAGRLQLDLRPLQLNQLIDGWLDDLSTLSDGRDLDVETNIPPDVQVLGEKRYTTLILQNLLENARKYNRPGGRVRILAETDGDQLILTICNTGPGIAPAAREHIFERFHRGAVGENVPGHGLGLSLARELARLHDGDLRLVRADAEWTEFEVAFRLAPQGARAYEPA
jgi:signal transduction histidine kinase